MHKGLVISILLLEAYLKYINNVLSLKSNNYLAIDSPVEVIFNFFLIEKDREKYYTDKWSTLPLAHTKPIKLEKFEFTLGGSYSLPPNQDYTNWGLVLPSRDNVLIVTDNNRFIYQITFNRDLTSTIEVIMGQQTLLTFVDSYYSDDIFVRKFDKFTYYIKNGKIILKIKELQTSFLTTLEPKELSPNPRIITFDLETITSASGLMNAYLFSMFNGKDKLSWFIDSPEDLFKELLRNKYYGYSVYAHNLSRFDLVFLFKYLASLAQEGIYSVDIIKKDDQVKSIKIFNQDKKVSITLKDSYLLLPASLADLANLFLESQQKTKEPVYVGDPDSPYYTGSLEHYSKDVELIMDLDEWKNKVRDYCINDSVILYDILIKFRTLIWDNWKIDATNYPTVTSLAFALFRQNYLEEGVIPIIKGKAYNFIKESYTGGSTEMYKPNPEGPVYCYDVNGLYPSQMATWGMPTGVIRQFEGDITILDQDRYYWIGDAQVSTKKDLYQPYLQVHQMTPQGSARTVAPNGTFRMKINSCEYFNALKDYNIQVRSGFLFDKTNIFYEYVNDMYYLRLQYPKDHPLNMIAKLMQNSLYGRFALNPVLENHLFCSFELLKELSQTANIVEEMTLGEDLMFVSYTSKDEIESSVKTSISIASAVTAYARVEMSKFKNNPDFELYYTDTDSIFIDKPLPDHMVGTRLGQMKLEYIFKDCVFLGPKIYAGITEDGRRYICKIKGYKNAKSIPLEDMKSLLRKDSNLTLSHNKWFRSLAEGNILIKEQLYELSKTENKRDFIYENNVAIDTRAFNILYSKRIKSIT
jgi:hypothetical protein